MSKLTRYKLVATIALLMSCAFFNNAVSQKSYRLIVRSVDKDSLFILKNVKLLTSFSTLKECENYIDNLPAVLQQKGYISASVDSILTNENEITIFLFAGRQYSKLNLRVRQRDKFILQQSQWDYNQVNSTAVDLFNFKAASEKLLDYFENTGYPFAKINLDSLQLNGDKIDAVLTIEKGFPYHVDSVRIFGSAKISRNFIHRYLNIEKGSLYSKEKLEKINQRLLELPYLQQVQPWNLSMLNTGSIVNLYLQPKKSNQVNVLAGFLPSNQQVGGKLLLTLDANLQLQNAFGGGESVGLIWQQIQPKSPKLHLNFTQPYMFNSPFGVDFLFELYKKDSAFLNLNGQLGLLYMVSPNKTGKVFLQTLQTNVLQLDTLSIKASKKLPDVADVSSLNLGVDYNVTNTDYRFNPHKGNEMSVVISAGNKLVRKNGTIMQMKDAGFNYNNLYDSIKLKTYQFRMQFKAAQYFKTGRQTVFKTAVNAGWYQSSNYYRNELFQIGGYRLLRGFDEESIYANKYAVATFEYRYLVGLNSNFFVFTDLGWSNNSIIKDTHEYAGAGAGMSFETKGGIFNISYAVGKRNDVSFDIKQSKIHLGYVSVF